MLKRIFFFSLALWLTACAAPTAAPPTSIFPPTAVGNRATALPLPTEPPATATVPPPTATWPPATATPIPLATPIGLAAPTPTPCVDSAAFLADLSVPDGTQFLPDQRLVKRWRVLNNGTCDWGPDYRLVLVEGDPLGAPNEVAVYPARAGAPADLEVAMQAPLAPGEYTGRWQIRDPQGRLFGAVVFIKIIVIPLQ